MTALEIAIDQCHPKIVMSLVKKGARLPVKSKYFHKLCQIGNAELVEKYLQSYKSNQHADGKLLDAVIRANNVLAHEVACLIARK